MGNALSGVNQPDAVLIAEIKQTLLQGGDAAVRARHIVIQNGGHALRVCDPVCLHFPEIVDHQRPRSIVCQTGVHLCGDDISRKDLEAGFPAEDLLCNRLLHMALPCMTER